MLPDIEIFKPKDISYLLMDVQDWTTIILKKNEGFTPLYNHICNIFTKNSNNTAVLDIGANFGGFTIDTAYAMQQAGNNNVVYSFEPQRIIFQQLCANIFYNRLDNVYTHNIALSNKKQRITMPELNFHTSSNSGGYSMDPFSVNAMNQERAQGLNRDINYYDANMTQHIEKMCLNDIAITKRITFIKADVEGHELEMFEGGQHTLQQHGYPPILFELWHNRSWYNEKAEKTKKFLRDIGYILTNIEGDDMLAQHKKQGNFLHITKNDNQYNFDLQPTLSDDGV